MVSRAYDLGAAHSETSEGRASASQGLSTIEHGAPGGRALDHIDSLGKQFACLGLVGLDDSPGEGASRRFPRWKRSTARHRPSSVFQLTVDNCASHKHPAALAWHENHPRGIFTRTRTIHARRISSSGSSEAKYSASNSQLPACRPVCLPGIANRPSSTQHPAP
jgi:hypothetical protein